MKIEIELEEIDILRNKITALEKENFQLKTFIKNSDQFAVSKMGKDFKGNKLNEDNCPGVSPVLYKGTLYKTANRYHEGVELVNHWGEFVKTVNMKDIQLVDLKFKYSDKNQ